MISSFVRQIHFMNNPNYHDYSGIGEDVIDGFGINTSEWSNYLSSISSLFGLSSSEFAGYIYANYNVNNLEDFSLFVERLGGLASIVNNYKGEYKLLIDDLAGQERFDESKKVLLKNAKYVRMFNNINMPLDERVKNDFKMVVENSASNSLDVVLNYSFLDEELENLEDAYEYLAEESNRGLGKEFEDAAKVNLLSVMPSSARPVTGFYNVGVESLLLRVMNCKEREWRVSYLGPGAHGKTQSIKVIKFLHEGIDDWLHYKMTIGVDYLDIDISSRKFYFGWLGQSSQELFDMELPLNLSLLAGISAWIRPEAYGIKILGEYKDINKHIPPRKYFFDNLRNMWKNYAIQSISQCRNYEDFYDKFGVSRNLINELVSYGKENAAQFLSEALSLDDSCILKFLANSNA